MAENNAPLVSDNATGKFRDMVNFVYTLDPKSTPFTTNIMAKDNNGSQILHEWPKDEIRAARLNAIAEGSAYTNFTSYSPIECRNYNQILNENIKVSKTSQSIRTAGSNAKMRDQVEKGTKGIMKDIELAAISNVIEVGTGNRLMRGLPAWITSNVNLGTGGAVATTTAAATAGTTRPLTLAMLKAMNVQVFEAGGDPDVIMATPGMIDAIATLLTQAGSQVTLIENKYLKTAINVWVSQFGTMKLIPNRVQAGDAYSANCIFFLESKYWAMSYLRAFSSWELPALGSFNAMALECECTLEARNEKSSGMIADVTAA